MLKLKIIKETFCSIIKIDRIEKFSVGNTKCRHSVDKDRMEQCNTVFVSQSIRRT